MCLTNQVVKSFHFLKWLISISETLQLAQIRVFAFGQLGYNVYSHLWFSIPVVWKLISNSLRSLESN